MVGPWGLVVLGELSTKDRAGMNLVHGRPWNPKELPNKVVEFRTLCHPTQAVPVSDVRTELPRDPLYLTLYLCRCLTSPAST